MKYYLGILMVLFTFLQLNSQVLDVAVRIKLKPQVDKNYLANEDAKIKTLTFKHDVALSQTCPGPEKSTPDLLLYYNLRGKGSMSRGNWEKAIKDFLATGLFEDEVYEYGISHTNSCTNPVPVNDPDFMNTHVWPPNHYILLNS